MNLNFLIILIGSLCLSVTYILTTFAFIIKMLGAVNNINAKSWNLASVLTLFSSFFIAIALTSIAFLIDTNPNLYVLNKLFLISSIIIFLGHVLMFYSINLTSKLIKTFADFYFSKGLIIKLFEKKFKNFNFDFFSFIAWFFFMIGFIFPTFLAIIFNEYRTTLFQLSFVFNSIGTFITIVITDRRASLLSDKINMSDEDISKIKIYLSCVIINRIYASALILFILFSLLIYLP